MLCVPWLYPSAKLEWHAFSLFPHPRRPGHSCVCVQRGGDWTRALHRAIRDRVGEARDAANIGGVHLHDLGDPAGALRAPGVDFVQFFVDVLYLYMIFLYVYV